MFFRAVFRRPASRPTRTVDDVSGGDDGDDDDGMADDAVEVFFLPVCLHFTVFSSTDLGVVGDVDGDNAVVCFLLFFLCTLSFSSSASSTTAAAAAAAADDDDDFLRFTLHLASSLVPAGSDLLP